MNVNVTRIQVSITNEYVLNSQEYNINKCYFTFSQEYTNELVKKAIFEQGTNLVEEPIINNECMIPSEVLNRGTFTLRVYAYEIQDEELVLRYSPTPTLVYVRSGSYIEGAESPEVITPSQFEQYMQALNDGLVEVANVDIDAEQLSNGAKITITDRNNESKIVYVYNGAKGETGATGATGATGQPGKDGAIQYIAGDGISIADNIISAVLTDYVKKTDYASYSTGGVIKLNASNGVYINNGFLVGSTRTYEQYGNDGNTTVIAKGTLENVITGKGLATQTYVNNAIAGAITDALGGSY